MKKGFEIYIQRDLSEEEMSEAVNFANSFINKTTGDPKFRYFGTPTGGRTSGLWRNRMGISIGQNSEMVFRRISKNTRRFGICKKNQLEVFNDKFLDKKNKEERGLYQNGELPNSICICPRHAGSIKVRFRNKPVMFLYAKIGEIKG